MLAAGGELLAFLKIETSRDQLGAAPVSAAILKLSAAATQASSAGYGAVYPIHRLLGHRDTLHGVWMFVLSARLLLTGTATARISGSRNEEFGFVIRTFSLLLRPFFDFESWTALGIGSKLALPAGFIGLLMNRTRIPVLIDATSNRQQASGKILQRGAV
jgi:hypothetical protein